MADPLSKIIIRKLRQVFIWPIEAALGFGFYGLARLLPVAIASAVMGALIGFIGPLTPWHDRARRNMKLALPDQSDAERNHILRQMWFNFGRVIGEFPHVKSLAKTGRIEFVGLEHIEAIKGGGFLIGAHIGNWELGPYAALQAGKKVAAIYRPLNNPLLRGLLEQRQEHYGGDIYRKGREAALGMIASIRKGQFMCLLVDQQLREGMAVPFFGHDAKTSISHIKLAIKKQVPLLYMRTERLDGCNFRVTISPPLNMPKNDDDASIIAAATKINAELEGWIKERPEQWFWPHRRWGKNI